MPAVRFAGRKMLITGISIDVGFILLCLTAAVIAESKPVFDSRPAQLFAILCITATISLGSAFIICGSMARHLQKQLEPFRVFVAEQIRATEGVEMLVKRLSEDTVVRYDNLIGIVGALPGRMSAVEEQLTAYSEHLKGIEAAIGDLPDYGQGVIDGAQMRRSVLDGDSPP